MTIWNLGSINADHFYYLSHLPKPGETLLAISHTTGLGGKGANMSVAAARAGAHVRHIGAVGPDGGWAVERLTEYGVDTRTIGQVNVATATAIISVDQAGENSIIIDPGANHLISEQQVSHALSGANANDIFVTQNETNAQVDAARIAADANLTVAYAAAPFSAQAVEEILPLLSFLILNEVEAGQLTEATGKSPQDLGIETVIVTKGGAGADLYRDGQNTKSFAAIKVEPVDTTGAGDTFTGYVLAGMDRGLTIDQSISLAMRAGALMVMRQGTADVIPDLKEVENFSLDQ
ncbi:ribokinase [Thalassobium sp. R2A62]|jgi:ribokinase|uniref:ribokinase n=1 Tax=Thalassobium sp. R2A62 TaxID=633131 RepID=UPI0001B1D455|nr:ribokinase [Thalassobium sp. R2A62]EET49067.1 ribokinase [Thalassobium sp. R2A62]MDG2452265.1 ribokinase [Paracoccaceae bacterium]